MIKNYFKIALRNLFKNKTYAAINIFGLALAFLCSTLLFLNAWYELSYDSSYADGERIYKVYHYSLGPDGEDLNASMGLPVAPTLKAEIPLIEASSRFMSNEHDVEAQGKKMSLQVNLVDADFFKVFSMPIIKGNASSPLTDLNDVVMTNYAAKRLFGDADPIGKNIKVKITGEWRELRVCAITEDFPDNSSLKYDVLARPELASDYATEKNAWNHQDHDVYVKLKVGALVKAVEQQMVYMNDRYQTLDTTYLQSLGYQKDALGHYQSMKLLPLAEWHFNTRIGARNGATSKSYVYTILLISFFILVIACFNFVNLNIARAFTRSKEVGVRKYLGATKKQVFLQIWGESLVICIVALAIGLFAATVIYPHFNKIFGAELKLSFFMKPSTIIMLVLSVTIISAFAGGYPALSISRLSISGVLKGNASLKKPGFFRNSLIVAQFSAACILMACTLIAYQQFNYMRNKPMGYVKDSVISFPVPHQSQQDVMALLRNKLLQQTSVLGMSGSDLNIGIGKDGAVSKWSRGFGRNGKSIKSNWMKVDSEFLKTMGIPVKQGRDFRKGTAEPEGSVIVTESMAKQFEESDPIGVSFVPDSAGPRYTIVGVIPDFHLYSLHEKTEPLLLELSSPESLNYAFVKTKTDNPYQVLKQIENSYKELFPGIEFKGSFLDENTDRWYRKEKHLSLLLGTSAIVAVLLSCLGLFAMALLMIQQRVKEIGVRKVLGASVLSINKLLAKDFLVLVLISLFISTPLAWWSMSNWLRDFPYHITISWLLFIGVGFTAILIALVTISFHTIKAALSNPIKSLRTE